MVEINLIELFCIKDNDTVGFKRNLYYSITLISNIYEDYYLYYTYGYNFDKDFVSEHFITKSERRKIIISKLFE